MTNEPRPSPALREMENQVHALNRLATVVRLLGEVPDVISIDHAVIGELGRQMEEIADVLKENWSAAFRDAGGQA